MAFTIFYAWQSDQPNNLCRGLIGRALDDAKKLLDDDLEIQNAVRNIEIDKDTQGIPGSPPVAEAILEKIRACNAFVADLTFIQTHRGDPGTPNPNVLIEYGYALSALGDQRIIGVFNEAFGKPEDLPFNLQHKRWPIRYQVDDESQSEEAKLARREERNKLTNTLADAIRSIILVFAESTVSDVTESSSPNEAQAAHLAVRPRVDISVNGRIVTEQFPWDSRLVSQENDIEIRFLEGPSIFLSLPFAEREFSLNHLETKEIARKFLKPLAGYRASSWGRAGSRYGSAAYIHPDGDLSTAFTVSMLTRNKGLYGIDRHLLRARDDDESNKRYIPTAAVEEILIDGLENFLTVAEDGLNLEPPLDVAVGLEGVEGYMLAVDYSRFLEKFIGPVHEDRIDHQFTVHTYVIDPFEALLPFFDKIYDAASFIRPDVRSVGRSQRCGEAKDRSSRPKRL